MRTERDIADDENFWQQVGRDGLMEPFQVLLALTDLEIERRQFEMGLPLWYDGRVLGWWKP